MAGGGASSCSRRGTNPNNTLILSLETIRRRQWLEAGVGPASGGGGADPLQAEALLVVAIAHQSSEARRRRARGARAKLQQLRALRSRTNRYTFPETQRDSEIPREADEGRAGDRERTRDTQCDRVR